MKKLLSLTESKTGWVMLSCSSFFIFFIALGFQYFMSLEPCVMCIEERILVLLIGFLALIPLFYPKSRVLRFTGYVCIFSTAILGVLISSEHIAIQNGEAGLFVTCDLYPRVPAWLPLYEWMPYAFYPSGDCGDIDWEFLSLSMVEWVRVIFLTYILIPLAVITGRKII